MHRVQVEMSVETITLSGQVVSRKLSKVERTVPTLKAGLEITENGVDRLLVNECGEMGTVSNLSNYFGNLSYE